ncbi:hypothetical protein GS502_10575, partial [Rhodococcus hoagii]|nr:hypothetical protein [Prescottella equi]
MDTDLIEQTVVVTATIAQEADGHTNTVDLEAHLDGDGCVLPPVWRRVSLPHRPTRGSGALTSPTGASRATDTAAPT